jgi:hypothetical protein
METRNKVWWGDWQNRTIATRKKLICAMMLCALAYVGSVPILE